MVFWAVDGVIAGVRNSRLHWTLCRVQFEHVGLLSSHYQGKGVSIDHVIVLDSSYLDSSPFALCTSTSCLSMNSSHYSHFTDLL
jgi:hypothetical protein